MKNDFDFENENDKFRGRDEAITITGFLGCLMFRNFLQTVPTCRGGHRTGVWEHWEVLVTSQTHLSRFQQLLSNFNF